nr:MAG TPA_asm: CRISPR-associated endonuclease [Caudoviricetes sp.]
MSIRSKWTDFDKETSKYIKKRDNDRCIYCGGRGATQKAHIFKNRSHGGKGCKENGCLLCVKCHQALDNPIGNQSFEADKIKTFCMEYLQRVENFKADEEFLKSLEYQKGKVEIKIKEIQEKKFERCKDCIYLAKKNAGNSTISNYYCRIRKIRISKNSKACKKYKSKL